MNVETAFKNVIGREMSNEEIARYLKFQREFDIPDSDPVWILFVWFEFYQRIFEHFPDKATQKAEKVSQALREAANQVVIATREEIERIKTNSSTEIKKLEAEAKVRIAEQGTATFASMQAEIKKIGAETRANIVETLDSEIPKTVDQLRSQYTWSLHKKWAIALGVIVCFGVGGGAWGLWSFYEYAKNVGISEVSIALRGSNDFVHFMKCDREGWKKEWIQVKHGKYLACFPIAGTAGWIIPQ